MLKQAFLGSNQRNLMLPDSPERLVCPDMQRAYYGSGCCEGCTEKISVKVETRHGVVKSKEIWSRQSGVDSGNLRKGYKNNKKTRHHLS